ncbi:hypothetical protein [Vibrio fluvialis]|uniref:hypothetical protein n=1 Tax=Vibrio fluvialis TaxID=676 RepID=UPI00056E600B|nr:hypothetical protein [Vibrio fluvialis]
MKQNIESAYYSLAGGIKIGNGLSCRLLKETDPDIQNSMLVNSVITTSKYSHIPVSLSSDDGLFWHPCIMLYKDNSPIGYMVFTFNWGSEYMDEGYYLQKLTFELNYIYILPDHRGQSFFSAFIDSFLDCFLEDLHNDLICSRFFNVQLAYHAEYASKEGRYIGSRFVEAFEDFCADHDYEFLDITDC